MLQFLINHSDFIFIGFLLLAFVMACKLEKIKQL